MLRTISAVSRLCRMTPNIHSRVVINCVRFRYGNRRGGDKRGPGNNTITTFDDENDTRDGVDSNRANSNLLDDK